MKSGGQKNSSNKQINNASVSGFGIIGNLTPFSSVPSFSIPSNLGDIPNELICPSDVSPVYEMRRPSIVSNDSSASISSLKTKISRSFSRSTEDNNNSSNSNCAPSHKQSSKSFEGANARKSQKKGNKFTKLAKEISGKSKRTFFKHTNSSAVQPNEQKSSSDDIRNNLPSPVESENVITEMHGRSYVEHVLTELMDTERSYVKDLRDIEEGYRIPMSQNSNFSEQDLQAVFCNIKHIYNFNRKLLKDLSKHRQNVPQVCQVFLDNKSGFDIYTNYCTNYQRSVETLEQYGSMPDRDGFIRACQRALEHPLPLHTYLFKPVQRILKYHLMFKNLSEHYNSSSSSSLSSSSDHAIVSSAYQCMLGVAKAINEVKKDQEEKSKVTRLLGNVQGLNGVSASTLGTLVVGGKLVSVGSREELKVFLLKKGILMTKKRKDSTLVFKMIIMCSNLILVEIIPREPLAFQVMDYDDSKNQCTLQAHSEEEKRIWCREIKKVILDSIKANVPEKARLLLLRPGLKQQDAEDSEIMHKMSRKMSENLDYMGHTLQRRAQQQPKTSTPLQPFLRSKLRKTAFAKFASEKKNKVKAKVNKRRSRSLENLNQHSIPPFPANSPSAAASSSSSSFIIAAAAATPEVEKVPFPEGGSVHAIGGRRVERPSPREESGFWSNARHTRRNSPTSVSSSSSSSAASTATKKSLGRAPSFKMALTGSDFYRLNTRQRISYGRSMSVTYSPGGSDDDDDDDDAKKDECHSSGSSLVSPPTPPLRNGCFEGDNICAPDCDDDEAAGEEKESDVDCFTSLERNDSTVTLSSGMSFNGNLSSESPSIVNGDDPLGGSVLFHSQQSISDDDHHHHHRNVYEIASREDGGKKEKEEEEDNDKDAVYSSDESSLTGDKEDPSVSANDDGGVPEVKRESPAVDEHSLPEKPPPGGRTTDPAVGGVESPPDTPDFDFLLRKKRDVRGQVGENNFRSSLLKRKAAFYRQARKFVPRRSKTYLQLEQQQQRKASISAISNLQCSGKQKEEEEDELEEVPPGVKLALSDDSFPISSPIDDEEMIDIIISAAREERESKAIQEKVDRRAEEEEEEENEEEEEEEEEENEENDENDEKCNSNDDDDDDGDVSSKRSEEGLAGARAPSSRNSGVAGLLELIASCQDLAEQVRDSFDDIKISDDSAPSPPGVVVMVVVDPCTGGDQLPGGTKPEKAEVEEEEEEVKVGKEGKEAEGKFDREEAPILKENERQANHLLRNKNCNYVFRLARAYSNRFKKMSGVNQEALGEAPAVSRRICSGVGASRAAGQGVRSVHLVDPAIQRAESGRIVKQRILQFQHSIS